MHLPFDGSAVDIVGDSEGLNPPTLNSGSNFGEGVVGQGLFGQAAVLPDQMPVGFDANSYTVSFWGKRLTTNPCSGDYLVEYRPVESTLPSTHSTQKP